MCSYINIWTHILKQLPKLPVTSAPALSPTLLPGFLLFFLPPSSSSSFYLILLFIYSLPSAPSTTHLSLHLCPRSVHLDQLGSGRWPPGLFPLSSSCLMINSASPGSWWNPVGYSTLEQQLSAFIRGSVATVIGQLIYDVWEYA